MSKNTQISELINYISVDGSGNVVLSSGQLVATQNYVSTAISNLVASAPSTLDTLNELATALGNDPNFATTIATSIGTKQAQLNGTGFVKVTGTTVSYDNSTYLTSDSLTGYIPYTGATASVNIGTNDLTSRYLVAAGASALGGVISIRQDATYIPKGNGYSSIASSDVMFDFFGYTGASTYKNFTLRFDSLTNNTRREYTLPDVDGTLALTSNLNNYLPLVGGTLTGALSGTSATFSSSIDTYAGFNMVGGTSYLTINRANTASDGVIIFRDATVNKWILGARGENTNNFYLYSYGTSGHPLVINYSTGATTFSSSITTNSGVIGNNSNNLYLSSNSSGGEISFWGNQLNTRLMTLLGSGNLGIATALPKNKLHVQGGNVTALFSGDSSLVNEYSGIVISPYAAQDANGLYGVEIRATITQSTPNYLNPRMDFLVQNTNSYLPVDRSIKMTILGNGNIGIGTSNPSALLHLMAPTGVGSSTQLIFDRAGGYGAYYVNYAYESTYYTNGSTLEFRAGNALTQLRLTSNNPYTAGNIQLMPTGGNVGIGTTLPNTKLEVNGGSVGNNIARFTNGANGGGTRGMTIYANDSYVKLQVSDNAGSQGTWAILSLNPDGGNVGIGMTNPDHKLDIVGNTRVDGTTMLGSNVGLLQFGMDGTRFNAYGYTTAHIKTSILKGADTMISFNIRGYMYSPQTLDTDVAFYCYAPVSYVYGVTINHKAYSGFTVGMYYSSDNYVCIYVDGLSTYGGFALNWINTSLIQHGGRIYALAWSKTNSTAAAY